MGSSVHPQPALAKIGGQGRLTLPRDVREAVKLDEGQVVAIEVVDEHTLVIRAKFVVDREQAWVWTDPWQDKLRAAQSDLEAGRAVTHDDDASFLASLESTD